MKNTPISHLHRQPPERGVVNSLFMQQTFT